MPFRVLAIELFSPISVLLVLSGCCAVAAVMAWFLSRRSLIHQTRHVADALRILGLGNLNVHLPNSKNDPLHEIKRGFNEVARQMQHLTQTKRRLSREMVLRNRYEGTLKHEKEMANAASSAKNHFMIELADSIRDSLAMIVLNARTIGEGITDHATGERVTAITNESRRMLDYLDRLVDNIRVESGDIDLEEAPLDLPALPMGIKRDLAAVLHERRLDFVVDVDPNTPRYVLGDERRLRQILHNLAGNAVTFARDGAVTIRVTLIKRDESHALVRFHVQDTGVGIPKKQLDLIFESYRSRTSDGDDESRHGAGLGTTIAKRLVETMGGRIGVSSEVGEGTVFWFDIPFHISEEAPTVVSQGEGEPTVEQPETTQTFRGTILVAEDYEISQEVIRMQLEKLGLNVDIVGDGRQAVDAAMGIRYDAILMDLQMPVLDGIEATRTIRESDGPCRNAPIVSLSAGCDAETMEKCRVAGFTDALNKPTHPNDIAAMFSQWMAPGTRPAPVKSTAQEASQPALGEFDAAATSTHPSRIVISDATPKPDREPQKAVLAEEAGTAKIDADNEVLDYERALHFFAGNAEVLNGALQRLGDSKLQIIEDLRSAYSEGNWEQLGAVAHKLKGGTACISANCVSRLASEIEQAAPSGNTDQLSTLLNRLEEQFDLLNRRIAEMLGDGS